MSTVQLPVLNEVPSLPTGKSHISFSEYSVHAECSFRHKLQYVDKVLPFDGSIYTEYGRSIHDAIETFLKTGKMPPSEDVEKYFRDQMVKILEKMSAEEEEKTLKQIDEFSINIKETLEQVPAWLDSTFPGWKVHSAEFNLFEKIASQTNVSFKGFIDAIIMVPKKERKNSKKYVLRLNDIKDNSELSNDYEYYIIDWKSCQTFWSSDKRRNFKTQMQIILYKHYFCTKFNVPLKDVKCGFGLLRMKTTKTNKDRIQFVLISAGEKTIDRALKEVNTMVNMTKKKIYMKNRNSCKYCPYYKTKFCL